MAQKSKLRVLLVDDSAETREYLRRLLQFESHIELVGMAANGKDAVTIAMEAKPDLILMDINMPVMDGISAAEIIFREVPAVRVVMMSVQSEMAYLRRAMQVGAREFLIKPFTHEELLNVLGEVSSLEQTPAEAASESPAGARVTRQARATELAILVAVYSPRGGAGCSTLALNIAIALQGQRRASVLLMDGNLRFSSLDAMLNLQVSRSVTDIVPALHDADPELVHAATVPHATGIRLLAGPPRPEMADLITGRQVEQIVALARKRYDYVVVDAGSALDDRAVNLLDDADCIFVPLTPDIPAIKNVRLFLEVSQDLGFDPDKIKLVLNRSNPRGGIDADGIEKHLGVPIVASIPESPRIVQTAINRGVPVLLYENQVHKKIPVTRQLVTIAELVPRKGIVKPARPEEIEEVPEPRRVAPKSVAPTREKKGLLQRLFGGGA